MPSKWFQKSNQKIHDQFTTLKVFSSAFITEHKMKNKIDHNFRTVHKSEWGFLKSSTPHVHHISKGK